MKKIEAISSFVKSSVSKIATFSTTTAISLLYPRVVSAQAVNPNLQVDERDLGFNIPSFGDILTFLIRGFFVAAGVFALLYLLLGAFSWVTSGGNKENVEKARDKIQAAIVGVILIVIVVALVATLEQIVFQENLCFGLTCPVTIPRLLEDPRPGP